MTFNSLLFLYFLIPFFILYVFLPRKWQNRLLLAASCFFYGSWDWRFLPLIAITITTDFFCGLKIGTVTHEGSRKWFLLLSLLVNLGILGTFKYFNFFSDGLCSLLMSFGWQIHPVLLKVALPLGISFYTFKSLSYIFDVYTGLMKPTRRYDDYALFVLFFPQLSAGPIMRARELLPQIELPRVLNTIRFYEGCYYIFWGLFQKVFVADHLAAIVDPAFVSGTTITGANLLLATYAFAFQIYGDFAGYSNVSKGIAHCMGFETVTNFNLPYFSTNPQVFWQRWHISLSTWLRDYIFIPLSFVFRSAGKAGVAVAVMITFAVCGLWHGAAWTFVLWGVYQGILLAGQSLLAGIWKVLPRAQNGFYKTMSFSIRLILFFHLICLGFLLFRSPSIGQFLDGLKGICFRFELTSLDITKLLMFIEFIWPLFVVELGQVFLKSELWILKTPVAMRIILYVLAYLLVQTYGVSSGQNFIYFKF